MSISLPTGAAGTSGPRGCGIYAKRPAVCRAWSCRWLFDADTAELRRPDLSGYIVDCTPDTVLANGQPVTVLQVWVDPNRRDAHRDPALRRYLALMASRHECFAVIRWSATEGMVLIPPAMNDSGEWVEHESQINDTAEMIDRLRRAGATAAAERQLIERELWG